METKHTPGPWDFKHEDGDEWWFGGKGCSQIVIQPADGSSYSSFAVLGCADDDREKVIANARMIAAAPELLDALKMAHSFAALFNRRSDEAWAAADDVICAAIAKATGQ